MRKGNFNKTESHRYEQARNPDYEEGGVLRISGTFLLEHEEEIVNLIKHQSSLAEEKNKSHCVKKIAKIDGGLVVETTEHNLTMKIGKALQSAYKGKHSYKFRKGEKFVEVDWSRDQQEA